MTDASNWEPDHALIEQILAELRETGLLREEQLRSLGTKLASGKMRTEDWQVLIEMAVGGEARTDA